MNLLNPTTPEWHDDLRRGIWPRSALIWVVAIWTALLIIRPWEKLLPWMADLHVERMYALFALTVLFLSGQFRFVSSLQTTGAVLWFLALATSSALAFEPSTSWNTLYIYITVLMFFFALLSAIRTPYQLLFIIAVYLVSTGLFLCKSEWEYFLHDGHKFEMGVKRLAGANATFGHPNSVAAVASITLPLALFFWEVRREFTQTWPSSWRGAFSYALGLYFFIAASAIVLTNSRTGIMALGGFVLLVAIGKGNFSRVLASLAGGLVLIGIIWLLMPAENRHRMATLWGGATEGNFDDHVAVVSAEGRKVGVQQGLEMFSRFPVTGVGLDNYRYYRQRYLDGGILVAHNTYAAVLAETGAVGGAAFVFFIVAIFVNVRRTKRLAAIVADPMVQLLAKLAVACRTAILLLLFNGLASDLQGFDPLYWIAAYCVLAWIIANTIVQSLEAETFWEIDNGLELRQLPSPILEHSQLR